MNKFTTTLAAGMLLGGLGAIPASAATPAMPTAAVLAEGVTTTEVGYRHGYRRHSGMRHRMMRRRHCSLKVLIFCLRRTLMRRHYLLKLP